MHLANLLRSSNQRYMQFSPILTTVVARKCTTWRFVYVLIARLRCWLYPDIQFRLNLSLITTGRDCFGCQVTVTLRAMRRLLGWREWAQTPISVDRSLVFHCRLQLSGIWIESGPLTHILNTRLHLTAVDNRSFGLKNLPHESKKQLRILVSLITGHCCLNTRWDWQQVLFVHLANWKRKRHFTLCVSVRLLLPIINA
jgi:hypothetical protein